MKYLTLLGLLLATFACIPKKKQNQESQDTTAHKALSQEVNDPILKKIVEEAPVKGAILMYDFKQKRYYSNDFDWAKQGQLPASTYKIPNSLIALETGVMANDSVLIKWDGKKKYLKVWEQDMIFRQAFHLSCVPCYQAIARKVGVNRMRALIDQLKFGQMVFDSTSIDQFWLRGKSRVTPFEQIDFLTRFYVSKLPVSSRTEKIMKRMMIRKQTKDYILRGKTGLSNEGGKYNGWFVGYVEAKQNVYFFATNLKPKPGLSPKEFIPLRIELTLQALKQKGFM